MNNRTGFKFPQHPSSVQPIIEQEEDHSAIITQNVIPRNFSQEPIQEPIQEPLVETTQKPYEYTGDISYQKTTEHKQQVDVTKESSSEPKIHDIHNPYTSHTPKNPPKSPNEPPKGVEPRPEHIFDPNYDPVFTPVQKRNINWVKGETGPKGEHGERGERGERGEKGRAGPRGEKGETGEKGEKGDSGTNGANILNFPSDLEPMCDIDTSWTREFIYVPTHLLSIVCLGLYGKGRFKITIKHGDNFIMSNAGYVDTQETVVSVYKDFKNIPTDPCILSIEIKLLKSADFTSDEDEGPDNLTVHSVQIYM